MIKTLTPAELQMVTDPQVILAKNRIIKNVVELFGELSEGYKKIILELPQVNSALVNAKISKGENYQELPYVMLDFPRQFGKEDVFAIRSFFWWGHFFSITLHLEGKYQRLYSPVIDAALSQQVFNDWYLATADDKWQHHFSGSNYTKVNEQPKTVVSQLPFLKLAKKIPLAKWDETNNFFYENFSLLIKVISG